MAARGATGGGGQLGGGARTGGGAIQARLAAAGAQSRGQWGGKQKGTHTRVTINGPAPLGGGAAHQSRINGIARTAREGMAQSAVRGAGGYTGHDYDSRVSRNASGRAPGVRGWGLDDYI